jgi:hypothetical protein
VAPSLGNVLLQRVIDADPVPPENADGWPKAGPEQRTKKARAPVRLERVAKDGSRLVGRELDGPHRYATVAIGDGRFAGRPKVPNPACLTVGRLDEQATVELDHADRCRSRLARPPTPHRQENIGGTGWNPCGDHLADEGVAQAEEPPADPLPEIGPGAWFVHWAAPSFVKTC